jgi:hypothetical protein
MILLPKVIHPTGEPEFTPKKSEISALIADAFNGKIHIEWAPQAPVTTLGQLAFFIHFLKVWGIALCLGLKTAPCAIAVLTRLKR